MYFAERSVHSVPQVYTCPCCCCVRACSLSHDSTVPSGSLAGEGRLQTLGEALSEQCLCWSQAVSVTQHGPWHIPQELQVMLATRGLSPQGCHMSNISR